MNYYMYLLVSLAGMLTVIKLVFSELEGRTAIKTFNLKWLLHYQEPFTYGRTNSIILMCVFCYFFASAQTMFSMIWVLELLGFMAMGVIADGISQFMSYHYINGRFKKHILEADITKTEIKAALTKEDTELVYHSDPEFDMYQVMDTYIEEDNHLALISLDGGEFASKYTKLPPITYVVELLADKARSMLANQDIKVTTYTKEGKMPFKDDKIDVIVNELANYDKYEMYRSLKPGGHVIIDQMGSDNYQEILGMFVPFRIKGSWDKDNCSRTLQDIGFEIVDEFEYRGYIRFKSLSAVLTFMKGLAPEKVNKHEQYINFYASILKSIKENEFFDLTTHRFAVVARKKAD